MDPGVSAAVARTLARLGASRVFTATPLRDPAGVDAFRASGVDVTTVDRADDASTAAAVTADLTGVPGAVWLRDAAEIGAALGAIAEARRNRSPLLVLTTDADQRGPLRAVAKHVLAARHAGVEHAILEGAAGTLEGPRGPVAVTLDARFIDANAGGTLEGARSGDGHDGRERPGTTAQARSSEGADSPDALDTTDVVWSREHDDSEGALGTARGRDSSDAPGTLSPVPARAELDAVARALRECARPLIVAGIASRSLETGAWIRALAESLPAPVVVTPKARGVVPDPHPLVLGVLGLDDAVIDHADLVLALGLDTVELDAVRWRWRVPVIDVCPYVVDGLPWDSRMRLVAPIAAVLEGLAPALRGTRADWNVAELDRWKRALDDVPERDAGVAGCTAPAARRLVTLAREATPAGAIATFDGPRVAASMPWLCVAPGELLVPLSPELTGFALPAAIAARLARPDRPVVSFVDADTLPRSVAVANVARRLGVGFAIVPLGASAFALDLARAHGIEVAAHAGVLHQLADVGRGDRPVLLDPRIMAAWPS